MRMLLAVDLSEEMKNALLTEQNALYDRGVRGRFTPPENLHLTLAFIGEYPDSETVLEALSGLTFPPFSISLEGMGCFGDLRWAGIRESAPLEALARKARRALAEQGIPFDRKRFSPHVTLIRKASGKMPGIPLRQASMTVDAVSLMRSDRGKRGMLYTRLGEIEASPVPPEKKRRTE